MMLDLGNSLKLSQFLNDQTVYTTKNKQSFSSDAKVLEPRLKYIESFLTIIPTLQLQVKNQEKAISQLLTDNELFRKIQQRLLDEIFDLKTKMNSILLDDHQQYQYSKVLEQRMSELRQDLLLMMAQFRKQTQEDIVEKISFDLKQSFSPEDKLCGGGQNNSTQSTTVQRCKSQDKINQSQISPQYYSKEGKMSDIQLIKSLEMCDSPCSNKVKTMGYPREKLKVKHDWTKQATKHLQTKSELIKDIYLKFQNSQTKFIVQSPRKDCNDSIDMIREFFTAKNNMELSSSEAQAHLRKLQNPHCLLRKFDLRPFESAQYESRGSNQTAKQDPHEQKSDLNESLI